MIQKIWVFDIDGTLADDRSRDDNNYWEWAMANYHLLPVYADIIALIDQINREQDFLVFLTGRQEICRDVTEEWLRANLAHPHWLLYMRPTGTSPKKIPDYKAQMLQIYCKAHEGIPLVFYEDNVAVIQRVLEMKIKTRLPITIHYCREGSIVNTF